MPSIIIDGKSYEVQAGISLLKACQNLKIYIPSLCSHPDLVPFSCSNPAEAVYRSEQKFADNPNSGITHCGLCFVELEEKTEPVKACETIVEDGMNVMTKSETIFTIRRNNLAAVLNNHPKACLVCPNSEGCNRLLCMMNMPADQRCCSKFNTCELKEIAHYVGIDSPMSEVSLGTPRITAKGLFEFNLDLCIGCLRCVRACQDLQQNRALGFVRQRDRILVGTVKPSLRESGCKFCGACVTVCPTGAMMPLSEHCGRKLSISKVMLPPKEYIEFTSDVVDNFPEDEGVVQLLDDDKNIVYIAGCSNMKKELIDLLKTAKGVKFFTYEKDSMFTQRQNELIQQYIDIHGKQPRINEEIEDLF